MAGRHVTDHVKGIKMKKRLESYINNASLETIDNGMKWYDDANKYCQNISDSYSVSIELVASVVAALSPRNRWSRNLIDAENVISHFFKGTDLKSVGTFGKMLQKAVLLCNESLKHDERLSILNGRKIQSFYSNILGHSDKVTIDTWIDLAYSGKYKPTKKRANLTLTRYKKIENDLLKLSKKYKVEAYRLQAIIWLEFQRQVNNAK